MFFTPSDVEGILNSMEVIGEALPPSEKRGFFLATAAMRRAFCEGDPAERVHVHVLHPPTPLLTGWEDVGIITK